MVDENQISKEFQNSFAERLKEAFNQASNKFIADKLGVGKAAVTAYMQGRIPPYNKLIEISRITNCNLHWLLTGEGGKLFLPDADKSSTPQVIVLQSDKPNSGTSTCALLISRCLARKGLKTLLLDKSSYSIVSHVLLPQSFPSDLNKSSLWNFDLSADERMIFFSEFKDLHLAVSSYNTNVIKPSKSVSSHLMTVNEVTQYYDYIIVDSDARTNPFACEDWFINYFLKKSNLLIPYDFTGLTMSHLSRILSYFEEFKSKYKGVNFLGLFISKLSNSRKEIDAQFKVVLEDIKEEKIFESKIRKYSNYIFDRNLFKLSFPKENHPIFADYSKLTDELINSLNQVKENQL